MARKLAYESFKWKKERAFIESIGYDFSKALDPGSYIRNLRKSNLQIEDYCHYFGCLSAAYHSWAREAYLMDPANPTVSDHIYLSGTAGAAAQKLGGLPLKQ